MKDTDSECRLIKQWTTKAGLPAVVIHLKTAWSDHYCGYVGVPPGHPIHGLAYNEPTEKIDYQTILNTKVGLKPLSLLFTASVGALEGEEIRRSLDILLDVFGGLTYSGSGESGYPVQSNDWWLGFDTNHPYLIEEHGIKIDETYVESECERLAEQIVKHWPLQPAESATLSPA